jgi:hypothetical protein
MNKKKSRKMSVSPQDQELLEVLDRHPEMRERVLSILSMADNADGQPRRADDVEALLIEEIRKLGNATMGEWARSSEEQAAHQMRTEGKQQSKKNG